MFWGLIVEPGKCYKQTVEKSFHISMACLQPETCKDPGYLSFILKTGGKDFVLCNLQKGSVNQVQLDLNFNAGDEIAFTTSGAKNTIHLSGYLITDEEEEDNEMFMDSDSELDAEDLKLLSKKRKNQLGDTDPSKVPKLEPAEEDDDSSEDDFDQLEAIQEGNAGSDEEDSEEDEAEEEESDDDDDDEEDEEIVKPQTPVTNSKQNIKTPQKTPAVTNPATQINGNGSASGKKNKKGKETPKTNESTPHLQKTPSTPVITTPSKRTIEGGVIVEDSKVGNGPVAKSGKMVKVYYTGRLKNNNKQFDATTSGKGFDFRLGRGEVIKGWDIGVSGMKVGGKRKITIPAALGYGSKGAPPSIPPNSILVFDVELKGVN